MPGSAVQVMAAPVQKMAISQHLPFHSLEDGTSRPPAGPPLQFGALVATLPSSTGSAVSGPGL